MATFRPETASKCATPDNLYALYWLSDNKSVSPNNAEYAISTFSFVSPYAKFSFILALIFSASVLFG